MTSLPNTTHPVIAGFAPDPTVCRVGDDYYLANSSFEYFPGAPIYHSTDLVNWEQIGNIIDRTGQIDFGAGEDSGGIYGSTLRYHDGKFWFVTTNISDFRAGQLLFSATDPAGPWSDPVKVPLFGIDPDLVWDRDGNCRLTLRNFVTTPTGIGEAFIGQAIIDPGTGELLSDVKAIFPGTGQSDTEGPHVYEIDGKWYLLVAEGGTQRGHCVVVARSDSPDGPYELAPNNPLLTHRSTDLPVQCTGHADLVRTPDGDWAMVFLGTRPRGSGYGFHVLGRETFLAGVEFSEQGWPRVTEPQVAIPDRAHSFEDKFSGAQLGHRWITPARPRDFVSEAELGIRLTQVNGDAGIFTRVQDHRWLAEADVSVVAGVAGLTLRISSDFRCEVRLGAGVVNAVAYLGGVEMVLGTVPWDYDSAVLGIESVDAIGNARVQTIAPDRLKFTVFANGQRVNLGEIDGRYFSTELAGGFTGRVIGPTVSGGMAQVRSFTYTTK